MVKNRILLLLIANVLLGLFIFLDIEKKETPSSEIRTRIAEITSVIDEIKIFQPAISQRIEFVKDLNDIVAILDRSSDNFNKRMIF